MAMNLASVENINRIVHQLNDGDYDISPDQFYDRVVQDSLKVGKENYVHLRETEERDLPRGTKKIQLRRWGGLTAHTTPLKEGIPPNPDKTSMEHITFTATQFGRFMEFTDRVNLDQIDPQLAHYTRELGDVMVRTLERYARETLLSASSKLFANGRTSVGELRVGDKILLDDLRFAALRMRRLLVKPINGYFKYICSPEYLYDIVDDPLVRDYMEINQTTKNLYNDGKPFPMFTIQFIPTMLDEFYTPDLDHPGEFYQNSEYKCRAYAVSGDVVYYTNFSASTNRAISGTVQYLHDGTAIEDKVTWDLTPLFSVGNVISIDSTDSGGNRVASTVTVVADGGVTDASAEIALTDVNELSFAQLPVHKGILYGKEGLIKVGISGEKNAKHFKQGLGSSGTSDPLHQRQTIGVKINSIGFGLLREESVTVTYSVPTQAMYVSGLTADIVQVSESVAGAPADTNDNTLTHHSYTVNKESITEGNVISNLE
jgi:hypothetical protein